MTDRRAAGDAPAALEHTPQRCRDGFGPVVRAQLAAGNTPEPLGDVAHRDGHDWKVAGERFLDGVGRAFLGRSEDQRVAGRHVIRHLHMRHVPADNEAGRRSSREQRDRAGRQPIALPGKLWIADEEDEALALGQSQAVAGADPRLRTEQLEIYS